MTLSKIANSQQPRKRLSALAQLVRILMRDGITTTSALMEETGYSERSIWSARRELRHAGAEHWVQHAAVEGAAERTQSTALGCSGVHSVAGDRVQHAAVEGAAERRVGKERVSPHTPLPKETPACMQQQPAGIQEIEGLNGSTPKLVSQFARLLAGPLGTPDPETAFDLLAGNVELYGAERVKIGFLEFQQKMASEPRVRDPLKLFNGFMKGARLPKADDPKGEYAAVDRQYARLRREHEKPLEAISYGF